MVKVFRSINEWATKKNEIIGHRSTLGFVPTMGALHDGHLSLVERALRENDNALISIFLNPTQFNNPDDLDSYPKTFENDIAKLSELSQKANKNIFVFAPNKDEIYPENYTFRVNETQISSLLCGQSRPGHFEGVLTIVMKLLNIAGANNAYFGKKDFQQYLLIKNMANAFFLPVNIIGCETVREDDGLALSSRNLLLKTEDRNKASLIYKMISKEKDLSKAKDELTKAGFSVDYLEDRFNRRFCAANLGDVRLIDNVEL